MSSPKPMKVIYEIEKLDTGFLVTKDQNTRVGISNIEYLEKEIEKSISNQMNLKDHLYYRDIVKGMKITIEIETINKTP